MFYGSKHAIENISSNSEEIKNYSRYPISIDELSSIFGVGEGKAKKYGKDFIELIAKHVEENNIDRPDDMVVKSAGKNSSLKLFIIQGIDRKLSIEDIAQSKSMQVEELISEMETIVYSGTKLDLSYCIDEYLDEDQQDELFDYFIESETDEIEHDDWKWATIEDIKDIENTEIPIYLLEKALKLAGFDKNE